MYNIYTYEKREEDKKQKQKQIEILQPRKLTKKEEQKRNRMSDNYNKRVIEFVTDMVNPENQIRINDNKKISNTREEMINDYGIQKPFCFKGFKTEKDRINSIIKNNPFLSKSIDLIPTSPNNKKLVHPLSPVNKASSKINKNETNLTTDPNNTCPYKGIHMHCSFTKQSKTSINNEPLYKANKNDIYFYDYKDNFPRSPPNKKYSTIIQQQMRFKPRTDLERVIDTLNMGPRYSNIDQHVLQKHLNKLNLDNPIIDENKKNINFNNSKEHFLIQEAKFMDELTKKLMNPNSQCELNVGNNGNGKGELGHDKDIKSFTENFLMEQKDHIVNYKTISANIISNMKNKMKVMNYKEDKNAKLNSIINSSSSRNNNSNSNSNGVGVLNTDGNVNSNCEINRDSKQFKRIVMDEILMKKYSLAKKLLSKKLEARDIMSDFHVKTHFKAVEEIADNQLKTSKLNAINQFTKSKPPQKAKKKQLKKHIAFTEGEDEPDYIDFYQNGYNERHEEDDITKLNNLCSSSLNNRYNEQANDLKNMEFSEYKKNLNPFVKHNQYNFSTYYDNNKDSLNELNNLIKKSEFNNNENKDDEKEGKNGKNKIGLLDDNVKIGGKVYKHNSSINEIAKAILNNCNVYHNKSIHNNGNLKKLGGKLMFTGGMSVGDFQKVYGFNS